MVIGNLIELIGNSMVVRATAFIRLAPSAMFVHDMSAFVSDVLWGSPSSLLAQPCRAHWKNQVTVTLHQHSKVREAVRETMIYLKHARLCGDTKTAKHFALLEYMMFKTERSSVRV